MKQFFFEIKKGEDIIDSLEKSLAGLGIKNALIITLTGFAEDISFDGESNIYGPAAIEGSGHVSDGKIRIFASSSGITGDLLNAVSSGSSHVGILVG